MALVCSALALITACNSSRGDLFLLLPGLRPQACANISLPAPTDTVNYVVKIEFVSTDLDGRVVAHIYAIDPPTSGDTSWVRTTENNLTLLFPSTTPGPSSLWGGPVESTDYHVFVFKAIDNFGLHSAPCHSAFTSRTIAPEVSIDFPAPSRLLDAITSTSFTIHWSGRDPDGVFETEPIQYKYRLVDEPKVQLELDLGISTPSRSDLQEFFGSSAPQFADWDSLPPDSTFASVTHLIPGRRYYFAVTAFDEAGAYTPLFSPDSNLLSFRPSSLIPALKITVVSRFFEVTDPDPTPTIDEQDIWIVETPPSLALELLWSAEPSVSGQKVDAYRWIIDPVGGDLTDETPRRDPSQTYRWSDWSLGEDRTVIGPFPGDPMVPQKSQLYIQARDEFGFFSTVGLEFRTVTSSPAGRILAVDDWQGWPDRADFQPYGSFPTEAVQDTLFYAVGDFPYLGRPPGTVSDPGVFAGFDVDTLDYRFYPEEGIPLDLLMQYETVIWIIAAEDAGRRGDKFDSRDPMSALRFLNTIGEINTLAQYSSNGGNLWLIGDGVVPAIANGYVSRFGGTSFARYPLTGTGDRPTTASILWPGNFIYDFLHARSGVDLNTRGFPTPDKEVTKLIPYLPEYRTPGAPWPACDWPIPPGVCDDPRIGPAANRNLGRWSNLPALSITTEFADWPTSMPGSLDDISYISEPLEVIEAGTGLEPRLDTLYVLRSRIHDPACTPARASGKPGFLYYWGEEHGPVAWSSVPLWMFERTQLRELADVILGEFGHTRMSDPTMMTGPGSAHESVPKLLGTRGDMLTHGRN